MSYIKTIKQHNFSEIILDSKEKVLLTKDIDGIKVIKLGLFNGLKQVVYCSDNALVSHLIYKLGVHADHIRYFTDAVVKCRDIDEVKSKCLQLERELSEVSKLL